MPFDRFLIGFVDNNASLQRDLRPFLINDNAFANLQNAYVFRGRVRKRFGGQLMGYGVNNPLIAPLRSRVSISLGFTDGAGNFAGNVRALTGHPTMVAKVGQMFSIGTEIFTVQALGNPVVMLDTGSSATHTYDTTTTAFVFAGATPVTEVYFYPAEPIMGLTVYQKGAINDQPSFAFDTEFAYTFNQFFWTRSGTGANPIWHGNNNQFFWATTWSGITPNVQILFVTNFNASTGIPGANDDPIWSFDNTTWTPRTGANAFYFAPAGGAVATGPYVKTAKIIVAFKNRLVLLNTIENNGAAAPGINSAFINRCRYSHNGSPFSVNAWYEPNQTDAGGNKADGAGFIDATTEEAIVSAEFIKDRLIVFFERSTWELAYTGNQVLPFVWQKINTELGSQSTFSSVPFDKEILTVGNTGIHSCNGANVARIDNKIPDEIFDIGNKSSSESRVAGVRDYFVEQVYWTFPSSDENPILTFPNKVLVYNYRTGAWGINDDCITVFGYFDEINYITWNSTQLTWEQSNFIWASDNQSTKFRRVIAGNQQGYIFIVDPSISRNAPVMQITNITSFAPYIALNIVDHTLAVGDYILIENAQGVTGVNNNIYPVVRLGDTQNPPMNQSSYVIVGPASITGTYSGGGTATRVSNLGILSKQYNFYLNNAQNIYLSKIDFGVLKTSAGQVTVDYFPSASELSMLNEANLTGMIMGTGVLETSPYPVTLYPFEQVQDRLWHSVYFQTVGECVQIFIYMNPTQMTTPAISLADFELDAFICYTQNTGRLE